MRRDYATQLAEFLQCKKQGSFEQELLCEIFSEIKQVHQKQDEILRLLKEVYDGRRK